MLAEIFILRLEAILRASNAPAPGSSDTRFIPMKTGERPKIPQQAIADMLSFRTDMNNVVPH
jgi:hypothetical protein